MIHITDWLWTKSKTYFQSYSGAVRRMYLRMYRQEVALTHNVVPLYHACRGFHRHVFGILSDKMTGGKLLVFAHHRNVLDALEQGVLKTGHVEYIRIDGRTKVSMR